MSPRIAALALALPLLLACGGGTRWTMDITSDPPGALVYVNDYPRGVTPVEVPYLWIGQYRFELSLDGYEDIDEAIFIGKPWYTWVPFMGLLLDTLPFPVPHTRDVHFVMTPEPPDEEFF